MIHTDIMSIAGVRFSIASSGIKKDGIPDLLLVEFSDDTNVAGAFTTSAIVSETIHWNKRNIIGTQSAKLLVVNSGNANCFTGSHGLYAIEQITSYLSDTLNISEQSIYICSTGVIGEKLPYEKIINALPDCISRLSSDNLHLAANAIMTTDISPKVILKKSRISDKDISILIIAKGAGMAAPNLATVLSYIFTDALISKNILQEILLELIDESFNVFTVDGDMSTNDTVMMFATGKAENQKPISSNSECLLEFRKDLKQGLIEICDEIVRGGEGVTKIAKIHVSGAESKQAAKSVGLSIANSPLVKTALHGEDPNWGRIVMAIGKAKQKVNLNRFSLDIGSFNIVSEGELNEKYDETDTTLIYMQKNDVIDIFVNLGVTDDIHNQATITTCDLSKGYIEINADYRS